MYCYSSQCSRKLTLGAKVSLGVSPPARAASAEYIVRQERHVPTSLQNLTADCFKRIVELLLFRKFHLKTLLSVSGLEPGVTTPPGSPCVPVTARRHPTGADYYDFPTLSPRCTLICTHSAAGATDCASLLG